MRIVLILLGAIAFTESLRNAVHGDFARATYLICFAILMLLCVMNIKR